MQRCREGALAQKLMDQVVEKLRVEHYSLRTEKTYCHWIRRFILFHRKCHPAEMGKYEVEQFLSALAVKDKVSASTQNQALAALLFLYRKVLGTDLPWLDDVVRARRTVRIPVVLSPGEVRAVIEALPAPYQLMVQLLYGAGLRRTELLSLRVKDVKRAHPIPGPPSSKGEGEKSVPRYTLPRAPSHTTPSRAGAAENRERIDSDGLLRWIVWRAPLSPALPR